MSDMSLQRLLFVLQSWDVFHALAHPAFAGHLTDARARLRVGPRLRVSGSSLACALHVGCDFDNLT